MNQMQQLMKQAQEMQSKLQQAQEELAEQIFEGKAGGGLVTVTVSGKSEMKSVAIDPSLLTPDEKEVLEDLIVAAFNDAKSSAERAYGDMMSNVAGGMLPPDMKLPF